MNYKNTDKLRRAIAYYAVEKFIRSVSGSPNIRGVNEDKLMSSFMRAFDKDAGIISDTQQMELQDARTIIEREFIGLTEPFFSNIQVELDEDSIVFYSKRTETTSDGDTPYWVGKEYKHQMVMSMSDVIPYDMDFTNSKNVKRLLKCVVSLNKSMNGLVRVNTQLVGALYTLSQKMLFLRFLDKKFNDIRIQLAVFNERNRFVNNVNNFNEKYFGYSLVTLTRKRLESVLGSTQIPNRSVIFHDGEQLRQDFVRHVAGKIKKKYGNKIDELIRACVLEYNGPTEEDYMEEVNNLEPTNWGQRMQELIAQGLEDGTIIDGRQTVTISPSSVFYATNN
jgi:hypothetical protein